MMNFCRLPPESEPAVARRPGRLDREGADHLARRSRAPPPATMTPWRTMPLRPRAVSTALSASENPGTAPWPLRSSGTAREAAPPPLADRRARRAACRRAGSRRRRPTGVSPRQRQQQLVLAVAGDPGDAEDLAGAHDEADVLQRDVEVAAARRGSGPRPRTSPAPGAAALDLLDVLQAAADHHLGHRARALLGRHAGRRPPCRRAGSSRVSQSALISCSLWLM